MLVQKISPVVVVAQNTINAAFMNICCWNRCDECGRGHMRYDKMMECLAEHAVSKTLKIYVDTYSISKMIQVYIYIYMYL